MAKVHDYDFIVVGSGAGGGPLACNLALHPRGYRVALLEAGPDPADRPGTPTFYNTSVPALHTRASEDPRLSWEFFVQHYPDKGRQSKDTKYDKEGQGIFYPRAAAVGGCTAHHAMITLYPHRSDWDRLAKVLKDDSWSADKMRPLFERIENCQYLPRAAGQAADPVTGHGFEGWLPLSMADPTVAFKDPKLLEILMWAYLVAEIDANQPPEKRGVADLKATLADPDKAQEALKQVVGRLLKAGERAAERLPDSARQTLDMLKPGVEKLLNQRPRRGQSLLDLLGRLGKDVSDPFGLAELFQLVLVWLDPNRRFAADDQRAGAYSTPASVLHGVRTGVRERILAVRALYPDRLHLIPGALVTRVLINEKEMRAEGVRYRERGGPLYQATPAGRPKEPGGSPGRHVDLYVRPRGEVILAGGAFNTPQLLLLSGVGPAAHLKDRKVAKVYCDLPGVGKNLQDRYEVCVVGELPPKDGFTGFTVLEGSKFHAPGDACKEPAKAPPAESSGPDVGLREWFNHRGVYASNGVAMTIIRRSAQAEKLPDEPAVAPDLFIFGLPGNFRGYYRGYSCHTQNDPQTGQENHRRFTWAILKGRTRNRGPEAGTVELADNDPTHRPVINFNFFDSGSKEWRKDRDALIEAVRFVQLLLADPKLDAQIVWPRPEDLKDEQALGDFILREAWGHHACGTCKIGPKDDKDAVLDTRFRVRGVKNLRVVDASVFPEIPGFFIVTSIYMISEKASQDILADQEKPRDDWPKAPAL
jgi:choline dehydrogenase